MLNIPLKESRLYQEGRQDGRQEGRQEGQASLLIRLSQKKLGVVSEATRTQISGLPLSDLEMLSEALLEFSSVTELQVWLAQRT